jgi:hypothetical protein
MVSELKLGVEEGSLGCCSGVVPELDFSPEILLLGFSPEILPVPVEEDIK